MFEGRGETTPYTCREFCCTTLLLSEPDFWPLFPFPLVQLQSHKALHLRKYSADIGQLLSNMQNWVWWWADSNSFTSTTRPTNPVAAGPVLSTSPPETGREAAFHPPAPPTPFMTNPGLFLWIPASCLQEFSLHWSSSFFPVSSSSLSLY